MIWLVIEEYGSYTRDGAGETVRSICGYFTSLELTQEYIAAQRAALPTHFFDYEEIECLDSFSSNFFLIS